MSVQQLIRRANSPRHRQWGRLSARGIFRRARASFALLLTASTLATSTPFAAAQEGQVGEYELKAAILHNLLRFVEWPASAYPGPQAPTILCVLGHDPFGSSLTTVSSKEAANSRPVSIRHLNSAKATRDCHVLYIGSSERKAVPQILAALEGSSVLTVGEATQFVAQGGIIRFTLQDQQVRFEINLDAASRAQLKISSRLLVLARIVPGQNRNADGEGNAIRPRSFRILPSPSPFRAGLELGLSRSAVGIAESAPVGLFHHDCAWPPGSQPT